jgi:RNA polymerase sigma factor for flagellar operon FliA
MQTPSTTLLSRSRPTPEMEQLLQDNLHVVRAIARKVHRRLPRSVDLEDLISAGLIGLMEATAKFDPNKNIKFSGYAQFRVRGAILDSLRVLDWAPRSLRQKGRAVREATRALTSRLGYAPSEEEVASELKMSLYAYQLLLSDLKGSEIGSLHHAEADDSSEQDVAEIPTQQEDDSLFRCLRGEIEDRLAEAIENLSEQERLVITSYYYEEMTMAEIGETLGVCWTRIRQIHTSAVHHLRSALSDLAPQGAKEIARIRRKWCKAPDRLVLSESAA